MPRGKKLPLFLLCSGAEYAEYNRFLNTSKAEPPRL